MSMSKAMTAGGLLLLAVACSDLMVDPDTAAFNDSPTEVLDRRNPASTLLHRADMGCETECITPGEGVYFPTTEAATSRQGRNTKTVSYSAYNTEDAFVVEVTYAVDGPARAKATISVAINGEEAVFDDVSPGTTVTHRVDLPTDRVACDEVAYTVRQEGLGRPITFAGTYALIPLCPVPVLWNTLGSAEEVANSKIGPAGEIVGTVNFDHDVRLGKGVTPNVGGARSGVDFPVSVVNPERGAVEMWVQAYHYPRAYRYGAYGLVNVSHWRPEPGRLSPIKFDWYNGGRLQLVLRFNGTTVGMQVTGFEPPLDQPVHVAAVWDRQGIDGSGDYMRIYVDGQLAAASSESNAWGTELVAPAFRVATTWDDSFATDRFSVDNLKVWDFARTDFSDRFDE